ncbi:transposable element Tcb1 transposase [Trichonephila clavipes]|nr:transposable element Tcb1 transposase [Trichonephila clavipes]
MIFYVVELLDDWNVDVSSWKYPRNLESPRVSSPGFGNDSKMMVIIVDVTAQTTTELQHRLRNRYIFRSYCQKKQTEHSIRPVSSALFSYWYDSFKADRIQTLRAHWSICSFSLHSDSCRTLIWRASGTRYHQENTIERHRYGGAGWLVWGGIILVPRTDLHVQRVMMTDHI